MVPIHFTTGTGTPVWTQAGSFTGLYAITATNAEAATYYIKFFWAGTTPNKSLPPVVGVTVPNLTVPINTTGNGPTYVRGIVQNGPLWYTVTKNAGDTDATALSTGGDVITLLVE
jgi:hypothetical protein